ncbi:Chromosome partition protein Smc [Carpediemonas membranifera]|uniref:Chromosome partition protein Smc n=1 Tax=Carpediemonas membranifera TaxID=201153 RepID=A0A8J6E116_9EUKA|nr:Chromosome partition protein Smc [Carpediemonas membranifera]|eukprot:KAG9390052.1 Chromosome partition protein Smc [Carpediemonas membranifera]
MIDGETLPPLFQAYKKRIENNNRKIQALESDSSEIGKRVMKIATHVAQLDEGEDEMAKHLEQYKVEVLHTKNVWTQQRADQEKANAAVTRELLKKRTALAQVNQELKRKEAKHNVIEAQVTGDHVQTLKKTRATLEQAAIESSKERDEVVLKLASSISGLLEAKKVMDELNARRTAANDQTTKIRVKLAEREAEIKADEDKRSVNYRAVLASRLEAARHELDELAMRQAADQAAVESGTSRLAYLTKRLDQLLTPVVVVRYPAQPVLAAVEPMPVQGGVVAATEPVAAGAKTATVTATEGPTVETTTAVSSVPTSSTETSQTQPPVPAAAPVASVPTTTTQGSVSSGPSSVGSPEPVAEPEPQPLQAGDDSDGWGGW